MKRVLIYGGIAFLILFATLRPKSVASVLQPFADTVSSAAEGPGDFFESLTW